MVLAPPFVARYGTVTITGLAASPLTVPAPRPPMALRNPCANILNTHYGHIGIGVAVSGSRVYMVEDFTN